MRRMSLVLIALGTFLIVLGPMIRWYAYPRLAVAPANQRSITTLVGENATIFDIATLKEIQTTLTTTVNTTGDASTPDKREGAVTYVNSTSTVSSDGVMRSRDVVRMTFDARTGMAIADCCGDFVSDTEGVQTPITHEGLPAKFPFRTEKKSYPFWDGDLRKAVQIDYLESTQVEGVDVYKFSHTIPVTKIGTMEVPLSVLGLDGDETVTADKMYSNVRTLWVEPETGVVIKRTEAQNQTLDYEGQPRVTLTEVVTGFDDATVKANADEYGGQASLLHLVRAVVPQVSFVVGLLMLIGGLVLSRRRQGAGGTRVREMADTNA